MKLGTENKTKTIIAGVLLVVAVVSCWCVRFTAEARNRRPLHRRAAAVRPAARLRQAAPGATRPRTSRIRCWPSRSIPRLRFDLLKSSEDVTYKGTGRDIFRSQAEPPPIPEAVDSGRNNQDRRAAASAAADRFEVLRLCQSARTATSGSFSPRARTSSSPRKATSWTGATRSCTSDRTRWKCRMC